MEAVREGQTNSSSLIKAIEEDLRTSGILGDTLAIENHGRAISVRSQNVADHYLIIRADTAQLHLIKKMNNKEKEEIPVKTCLLKHDDEEKKVFFAKVGEHLTYLSAGEEWV